MLPRTLINPFLQEVRCVASSRRFPRQSRVRRKTSWDEGPSSGGIGTEGAGQTLSASGKVLWGVGQNLLADGITLVRTRGQVLAYLTAANSIGSGFYGAMGIALANTEAFLSGVASLLGPWSDANSDGWLWHQFFRLTSGAVIDGSNAADADIVNSVCAAFRLDLDSKAMRKMEVGQTMYGIIEVTEVGTAEMTFSAQTRQLAKLP